MTRRFPAPLRRRALALLLAAVLLPPFAAIVAQAQQVTNFASTMQALTAIYNALAGTLAVSGSVTPTPVNSAGNYSPATVGSTPSTIVAALSSGTRTIVDVRNLSASATVCLSLGGTATISGSTCAAGEIPLGPGGDQAWPIGGSTFVPADAISAIASGAGTPLTVGVK